MSQGSSVASGLVRVTIASGSRRVDLVLPGSIPVAELVPELARSVGLLDASTVYGGYRLVTQEGRILMDNAGLTMQGIEVEREPRLIHIYNFRFTEYTEPLAAFKLACTKGTYVRSVAHDLGNKLGCGAHLATLRRSVSGKFDVADAKTWDAVMNMSTAELEKRVIPYLKLVAA
jgi:hypothetical protein